MNIQDYILYEDQQILVCQKEAGIPVQTARMSQMDMESALKNYLVSKKQQNAIDKECSERNRTSTRRANVGNSPYLAVIHRLDQPVRGVLVFAKTPQAAKALNEQVVSHSLGKYYLAKVDGVIKEEQGTLTDYLLKDAKTNTSKVVKEGTPNCKKAVLHYKKKNDDTVEIELVTGRHHQIRVQLSHAGMPIQGDTKYNPDAAKGCLQLCAYRLVFRHPKSGKEMEFYYKEN